MKKRNIGRRCHYTPEQKQEILAWHREHGCRAKLTAEQFHVAYNSIRTWLDDSDISSTLGTTLMDSEDCLEMKVETEKPQFSKNILAEKLDIKLWHKVNGSNLDETSSKFGVDSDTIKQWLTEDTELKETQITEFSTSESVVLPTAESSVDLAADTGNDINQFVKKRTRFTPEEKLSVMAWHRENDSDLQKTSKQYSVEPEVISQWISQEGELLEMVSKKVDSYSLLSTNQIDLDPTSAHVKTEPGVYSILDLNLHYSHEERLSIIQWYHENGFDINRTSKKFGIRPRTIHRWLRTSSIVSPNVSQQQKFHKRYPPEEKEKILQFYFDNGAVLRKTCREFSVDPRTIRSWIAEHIRGGKKLPSLNNSLLLLQSVEPRPVLETTALKSNTSFHTFKTEKRRRNKNYTHKEKASIILWHLQNGRRLSRTALQFGITHHTVRSWIKFDAHFLKEYLNEEDFNTVLKLSKELSLGVGLKQRQAQRWRSRFQKQGNSTSMPSVTTEAISNTASPSTETSELDLKVPVLKLHRMDSKKPTRTKEEYENSDSMDDDEHYSTSENGDEFFIYEPLPGSVDESELQDDYNMEDLPDELSNSRFDTSGIPEENELLFEVADEDTEEEIPSVKPADTILDKKINDQQTYQAREPQDWRNEKIALKGNCPGRKVHGLNDSKTVAINTKSAATKCSKFASDSLHLECKAEARASNLTQERNGLEASNFFVSQRDVFPQEYIQETCHLFGEFVAMNLMGISPSYLMDLAKLDIQKVLIKYKAQSYGHL